MYRKDQAETDWADTEEIYKAADGESEDLETLWKDT